MSCRTCAASLRGSTTPLIERSEEAQALLERQWREYWAMTVEPRRIRRRCPLELVDGFDDARRAAVRGIGRAQGGDHAVRGRGTRLLAVRARAIPQGSAAKPGVSYRAYASAIAEHERQVGRRAHSFELNVQVLPLTQRGVWWIGSLTIAVTDGLRGDVVAFDAAIHPIIAELA